MLRASTIRRLKKSTVEESIDVDAPIREVYNQWTQFETFPKFMEHVESVQQIDDTHLKWTAKIAGKQEQWTAEVTEQHADERVAWQSTSGARHAGVVTFHRISDTSTKVMLQLDAEPHTLVEKIGDKLGVLDREAKGDLKRFKAFIEGRDGDETGQWRGDVPAPHQN
ncbi:MAG: SRPBCC family protein [Solirubrobacteraceae bacterium]